MQMRCLAVCMLWSSTCRRSNCGDGGIRDTLQMQMQIYFPKKKKATIAVRMVVVSLGWGSEFGGEIVNKCQRISCFQQVHLPFAPLNLKTQSAILCQIIACMQNCSGMCQELWLSGNLGGLCLLFSGFLESTFYCSSLSLLLWTRMQLQEIIPLRDYQESAVFQFICSFAAKSTTTQPYTKYQRNIKLYSQHLHFYINNSLILSNINYSTWLPK